MENNKKSKLIDLREREDSSQKDSEPVFLRKMDVDLSKDRNSFKRSSLTSDLKSKFLNRVKQSMKKDETRGVKSRDFSVSRSFGEFAQDDSNKIGGIFDKIILWLIYSLVFLLPLFVLPFSMEIYEFNKTLLLFAVSSLAFLFWIVKMVLVEKRLTFVRTPLGTPIIIFISLILVSTAFSVDKISSVLGFYGRFSDSLLVYLSLAMLYFTVVNAISYGSVERSCSGVLPESGPDDSLGRAPLHYARHSNFINDLVKTFLASAFIVAIVSLIYFLGLKFISWEEAQFRSFNLVGGSLNVLAMYLVSVIIIALSCINKNSKIAVKYALSLLVVLSLFILVVADFILAWIVLAASLVVVLALGIVNRVILKNRHSEAIAEGSQGDTQGIRSRDPIISLQDDRNNPLFASFLILLVSFVFIAGSLTFINKDVQTNFSSSAISDFLRDKLVGGEDNMAREGFTKEVIIEKGVAISVATDSSKSRPILGSGPGTYLYNFSKFKPVEFNNNNFWNIRFDKAGSEILEKISTIGIAGTLSYLLIVIFALIMFLKTLLWARVKNKNVTLRSDSDEESRNNVQEIKSRDPSDPSPAGESAQDDSIIMNYSFVYLFAAWFALLLFQFLYLETTTTKFIFWLFTAILAAEYCISKKDWNENCHSERAVATEGSQNDVRGIGSRDPIASLRDDSGKYGFFILDLKKNKTAFPVSLAVLLMISTSFAASYYYQMRFYKAETAYKSAIVKQSLDQNTSDLENIIELNPYRGEYEVYLSNVSLGRSAAVLQEQNEGAATEEDMQEIWLEAKNAIDHIKRAVELGPNNVSFQQKFGSTYAILNRNLNIEKADEWAIKGYQKAIELEPANPILHAELGRIYVLQSYRLEDDDKADQAIEEFEKARELKNDYADAILELGLAYEAKGDYEKAIETINSLENIGNISVNTAFQLGRIYYNSGEIGEAKNIFLEILKIEPNNSNARYSLGLIYEKEENNQAALMEFEAVLSLNPDNQEVIERVDKLKEIIEKENKKPEPVSEPVIEEESVEAETEGEIEE